MQEKFKTYASQFDPWAEQTNGMHQYLSKYNILVLNPPITKSPLKEQTSISLNPTSKPPFPVTDFLPLKVWTALESEGLGANLQHYNPLIDLPVANEWGIDEKWKLRAQMVFGQPLAPPGERQMKPVEERVKFYGA